MKSRHGCLLTAVGILLVAGLLILVTLGFYMRSWQNKLRARFAPPVVRITSPQDGARVAAGSYLPLSASISFSQETRVQAAEWWLDGVQLESGLVHPADGASIVYLHYDLLVPGEGGHLLFLRAINDQGVIGQSAPFFFLAEGKGLAYYTVTLDEGDSLESLAAKYGIDVSTMENLNQGLAGAASGAGTVVNVPIPPKEEAAGTSPPPAQAPALALVPSGPMLQPGGIAPGVLGLLTVKPPAAPANLQAQVQNCRVKLTWEDRADNEAGYEIWQTAPGAPSSKLVTLQAAPGGTAWYEFEAPGPGTFMFWVAAVNPGGGQPSNFVFASVEPSCPAGGATHLQLEIKDIHLQVAADRVYCYISLENAPEVRIPAQDGSFITMQAGHGDLAPWPHTYAVPFPPDNALDLSGECWGWAGKDLNKLGTFSTSLGKEIWNGADRLLSGGSFEITLAVQPEGTQAQDVVNYTNGPTIPVPYDLKDEAAADDMRARLLTWKWDGNVQDISEFVVFLNGSAVGYLSWYKADAFDEIKPDVFDEAINLSRGCGQDLKWQVAARSGAFLSGLSAPFEVKLPPCQSIARVRFLEVDLDCAAEGMASCLSGSKLCDTLDGYYQLSVNDDARSYWGGNSFIPVSCGRYTFHDLGSWYEVNKIYSSADSFMIPVGTGPFDLQIGVSFWDHDSVGSDDRIISISRALWFSSLENAMSSLGMEDASSQCVWISEPERELNDTAFASVIFSVEIFPNACQDAP